MAEDNRINRNLIKILVEKTGYPCSVVSNGQEVLDILSQEHFDILLLDMHMPVKNGTEVVREIRNSTTIRELYIILLTADTMRLGKERSIGEGLANDFDDYIVKPVDKVELKTKLDKSG
ncbi:MAG: response regulator [Spirochaetia bacterium]